MRRHAKLIGLIIGILGVDALIAELYLDIDGVPAGFASACLVVGFLMLAGMVALMRVVDDTTKE